MTEPQEQFINAATAVVFLLKQFINAATAVVFLLILIGCAAVVLTFARWVWGLA